MLTLVFRTLLHVFTSVLTGLFNILKQLGKIVLPTRSASLTLMTVMMKMVCNREGESVSISTSHLKIDFYCVYCPASGDSQCQHLPEFTTQEECEAAVACELPDGTVDFSLTEEECRYV